MENYVYIAGDIMSKGSQYEASLIEGVLDEVGIKYYSPRLNKSINDKKAVTVEENNKLAERIVKADTEHLNKANIVIFNIKESSIGTIVEVGQVLGLHNNQDNKKCFFLYDDIRRTSLEEVGDRRSWSINQYLHGAILELSNGRGIINSMEELKEELLKIK